MGISVLHLSGTNSSLGGFFEKEADFPHVIPLPGAAAVSCLEQFSEGTLLCGDM